MKTKYFVVLLLILIVSATLLADTDYVKARSMQIERIKERAHKAQSLFLNSKVLPTRDLKVTEMTREWWWYADNEWITADTKIYDYDYKGRVSGITEQFWNYDESEWTDYSFKTVITYLDNGELGVITTRFISSLFEIDMSRVSHQYNDKNQLTELEFVMNVEENEDFEWAPMLTITVYYGDDDRIDYLDFMEYYNDEEYRNGYGIARNFIYYDERGRYNEVLVEYADNGEDFEKDSKVEYVYHPSDTWTYPDVQKWLNNIGYSLILEFANSIENDAKFLTETFYGWYDDEYYPEDRTSYEYEDDKLTLAYYEWWDWDNEDWECENRGSYLYNANGLLEMYLEQFYSNHEEDWVNFERYVLTYDDISSADEHTIASPITKAVNYPNPFNPETTISFNLPKDQFVEVAVYNSKGQLIDKIISEDRSSGHNSVVWNGTDSANKPMPSGLYFYRITGENLSMKGKMLMLK